MRHEASRQGLRLGEPRWEPRFRSRDGGQGRFTEVGYQYQPHPVRSPTGLRQGTIETTVGRDGGVVTSTRFVDYRPAAAFGTATLLGGAAATGALLTRDGEDVPQELFGLGP
jgi:hypothetical protein